MDSGTRFPGPCGALGALLTVIVALAAGSGPAAAGAPTTTVRRASAATPAQDGYVDTHMHLGALAGGSAARRGQRPGSQTPGQQRGDARRSGAGNGGREAERAAAAAALVRLMDERGIAKAMVVCVPNPRSSDQARVYEEIRGAIASHEGRLYLMAGGAQLKTMMAGVEPDQVTDSMRARFRAAAEQLLAAGAVGFGEMIALHVALGDTHSYQHIPADHPLYLLLADIAANHDVPVDLHMEAVEEPMPMPANLRAATSLNPATLPASIPGLEKLLAHNREATIVWQHVGWDNIGQLTPGLLGRLLDDHPNLYASLRVEYRPFQVERRGVPMPNRIVDEAGIIRPEWLSLITRHPDRFVVGADEFVTPEGSPDAGHRSFAETWSMVQQLPAELRHRVGRDNAARIYRLQ